MNWGNHAAPRTPCQKPDEGHSSNFECAGLLFRSADNLVLLEKTRLSREKKNGGADWDRTSDPHNAIVVLYQLSYDPTRGTAIVWIRLKPSNAFSKTTNQPFE